MKFRVLFSFHKLYVFIHSFIHSFIYSFIYSFIHLFIHVFCRGRGGGGLYSVLYNVLGLRSAQLGPLCKNPFFKRPPPTPHTPTSFEKSLNSYTSYTVYIPEVKGGFDRSHPGVTRRAVRPPHLSDRAARDARGFNRTHSHSTSRRPNGVTARGGGGGGGDSGLRAAPPATFSHCHKNRQGGKKNGQHLGKKPTVRRGDSLSLDHGASSLLPEGEASWGQALRGKVDPWSNITVEGNRGKNREVTCMVSLRQDGY